MVTANVFDSVLETARFEDKLYAVPIWSNTQLLWYRKDRVDSAPKTWDEMIDAAEKIGPGKGRIQVQANRYEGLVVWANPMIESAGTSILTGPEEVELDEEPTKRALAVIGRLSRSPVADTGDHDLQRGIRGPRLRGGRLGLHGQLPVRLSVGEGQRAGRLQADRRRASTRPWSRARRAPRRSAGSTSASRRSRRTRTSRSTPTECLVSEQNQIEVAELEGLPPVRSDLYDRPEIEKIYPGFAERDQGVDPRRRRRGRRSRPPTRTCRWRSSARCIRRPGSTRRTSQSTYDELRDKVEQAIKREGLL